MQHCAFDLAYGASGAAYDQPLTQWHRRHPPQAPLYTSYPPIQLTDYYKSNMTRNPHRNTTLADDVHSTASISSITGPSNVAPILVQNSTNAVPSAPTFIPSTFNHEESRDGFFCFSVGMGPLRPHGLRACTHCRRTKLKCVFDSDVGICRRCRVDGQRCTVAFRKPKDSGRTCHYLEAQIRQKDQIIQSLLEQLHISPLSISSYRMGTSPSDTINQASRSDLNPSLQPVAGGIYTDFASFISSPKSIDPYLASIALQQPDTGNGNEVKNAKPSVPFGLIEDLGPRYSCCQGPGNVGERKSDGLEDTVGGANAAYSALGPSRNLRMRAHPLEQHFLPEILTHGIVVREDIAKLFGIFYANINPFLSLLDPVLHTPTSTFRRCPFLFTVVCAVSSRYYTEKSEIYPIAMHLAKRSAAKALNDGRKSVELCQAYILLSIYAVPTRKWEEDCSSLYTGLAIRLAIDLNLHQAPTGTTLNGSEKGERELLNRARVWMICFNLDRSAATQSGKPPTIEPDPHMWRRSNDWYQLSPYNSLCDMHLCAFTGLLLIVADFHDAVFSDPSAPFGPNKNVDFRSVTITHSARLAALSHKWTNRFAQASDSKDLAFAFQSKLFTFLGSYWRLAMFSFSFEQAYRIGLGSTDNIFFIECLECAKTVLSSMIDGLWPSAFMRYCPDELFTFVAFASAFLIKLLIEFSSLISEREESEMYDLIQRVIRTLNSPEIAVDDHHPSKIHAQFIARVLSHHHPNNAVYHRTPSMISNIAGSSMGYGHQWHTSPMFTISSLLGVETAYCSGYGPDEYQSFYAQFTCPTAE